MADADTKQWAEKSKRIEAEKLKAVAALQAEKPSREGLAYLDPQKTKIKGWSRDPNVILASMERIGSRAVILAVAGMVLSIIGDAGGAVAMMNKLGMVGVIISALPSGVGFLCMGLAGLMAAVVIGGEVVQKVKYKNKIGTAMWSAVGSLAILGVYMAVRMVLFKM